MSAEQVEPNFRAVGECGCGCGGFGTLRTKPWRSNGVTCLKRGCPCRQCMGRASKSRGQKRQAKATTALGVPRSSIHPGHEEFLGGTVRIEVKSGMQALPVWTKYLASEAQSNAARAVGDNRPFVACFEPKGTTDGLVVFRRSELEQVVAALAEQLGMVS